MASSNDSVNVEILFVEGVLDDHVQLMTGMIACCIALPGKTDEFSVQRLRRAWQPNVNLAVSRQTVNRRLVAHAYKARRMVTIPRLTVRAKLVTSLGPETHQSTTRPMATCHLLLFRIDNRIRVRRLVGEAMN